MKTRKTFWVGFMGMIFAFLVWVSVSGQAFSEERVPPVSSQEAVHIEAADAVSPDEYEPDNTWETSSVIMLNDQMPYDDFSFLNPIQDHNFHAPGDVDWVNFFILKDEIYKITVDSAGENCDVVITIYDTDGKTVIKEVDDTFDGEKEYAEWECDADGVYYARIKQYDPTKFGAGTEYRLSLTQPYMVWSGRIYGYVIPPMSVNLRTSISSARSMENGLYVMPHLPGDYTITAIKEGCSRNTTAVTVPQKEYVRIDINLECPVSQGFSLEVSITPKEAVIAGAKWRLDWRDWQESGSVLSDISLGAHTIEFWEITGWTTPASIPINVVGSEKFSLSGEYIPNPDFCLEVNGAKDIKVACVNYMGLKRAFTLNHYTKENTPQELYWEMDTKTFQSTGSFACIDVGPDLNLEIPCAEYNGIEYECVLKYYDDPDETDGIRWMMDRSTLRIK